MIQSIEKQINLIYELFWIFTKTTTFNKTLANLEIRELDQVKVFQYQDLKILMIIHQNNTSNNISHNNVSTYTAYWLLDYTI